MRRFTKLLAVSLCAVFFVATMFGCGGGDNPGTDEQVNEAMSQIYVSNYNGGFGDNWLRALKKEFEEQNAERSFETGKKGVQIIIDNHKATATQLASMKTSRNMVYFLQGDYYSYALDGSFADITDIVTEGGENSIASRLSAEQKKYYTMKDGKYFALPREEGINVMTYDVDLFENESLFFAKNGCPSESSYSGSIKFTSKGEKSTGPDGKYGTSDDGLPGTYEEMFVLFDRMVERGIIPLTWTGWYYRYYLQWWLQGIIADYEGYDQVKLFYNHDGKQMSTLVKSITENSSALFDDIEFEEPTEITIENGYLKYKSAGRYYALKVLEKILSNTDYYDYDNCFNGTVSHTDAQDNFLYSSVENNPVGILIEGSWWVNEARSTFESMAEEYDLGAKDRRLAIMPFPKVDKDHLGEATYFNSQQSMAFINGNLSGEKLAMAKEFYKFAYSEKALRDFTTITEATLGLNYDLTDEQYDSLSYFGKSVWDIHSGKMGKTVSIVTGNNKVASKMAQFKEFDSMETKVDGKSYNVPADCFRKKTISALDYFKGIPDFYSETWWNNNVNN